jgi:hypothetical protein
MTHPNLSASQYPSLSCPLSNRTLDVRSVVDKQQHNIRVVILRCPAQRLIINGVNICAVLDQQLHNVCMTMLSCKPQRKIVTRVNVCAALEEQLHNGCVAHFRSQP